MQRSLKVHWKRHVPGIAYTVIAWMFAVSLFGFVRRFGLQQPEFQNAIGVTWRIDMIAHLVAGILIGLASGIVNVALDTKLVRRLPFGITIIVKSLSFGAVFTAAFTLNLFLLDSLVPGAISIMSRLGDGGARAFIVVAFVFAAVVNLVVDFVRQVDRKLGPGVLAKSLIGKYHKPREEQRIFMFLDLTSSTSHAEHLGHIRYSRLLQDCFFDLTDVVTRFHAEVYQYVGDEVVLTWELEAGLENANFIRAQQAFMDILEQKEEYYEATYGFVPEFKAGAHAGRITVAEVGEVKRDIAYHGDVLNTAARIRGKCNEFETPFLISGTLLEMMQHTGGCIFQRIGDVALRGKEKAIGLYAVHQGLTVTHEPDHNSRGHLRNTPAPDRRSVHVTHIPRRPNLPVRDQELYPISHTIHHISGVQ